MIEDLDSDDEVSGLIVGNPDTSNSNQSAKTGTSKDTDDGFTVVHRNTSRNKTNVQASNQETSKPIEPPKTKESPKVKEPPKAKEPPKKQTTPEKAKRPKKKTRKPRASTTC